MNPYQVVEDFEQALCDYTGARYAVTVTSCTMALLLALKHWSGIHSRFCAGEPDPEECMVEMGSEPTIIIPSRTYISVPMSIKHAGLNVGFVDKVWLGEYELEPYPIWDSARLFTSGMCDGMIEEGMKCVSFHWTKTLAIGQGGAILTNDELADEWLRKMRFDGRTAGVAPKDDDFDMIGHHCYMSPRDAADGLSRLAVLPKTNAPLPNDDYPDLSKMEIFK